MTNRETMELFIEKNGQETVAYPFVEKDHVVFGNGMGIEEVIEQDISMPTVTHEEVSFKVGVGDQDVSSAIVDSSVSEMTIKGKTYQNILPEPSTHVLTNNKEMFKVNEGLDPNVEIVDGVSKSAILKGQTLINIGLGDVITINYTGKILNSNLLKPNTVYTLCYNVTNVSDNVSNTNVSMFTNKALPFSVGYHKITRTTISEIKNTEIQLWGDSTDIRTITLEELVVVEGDYTNVDIPYFEGMLSVKAPVLKSIGKNLINMDNFQPYYNAKILSCNANSIVFNAPNDWAGVCIDLNLKPNTKYHISYECQKDNSIKTIIRYLNDDGTLTGTTSGGEDNFSFMTKGNGKVRVSIESNKVQNNIVLKNIQLEEASAATPYEPYKSNILSTSEEVELCGIGEVQDTLDLMTGELTQRIGEIVLDGSENWWMMNEENTTNKRFRVDFISKKNNNDKTILCKELLSVPNSEWNVDREQIEADGYTISIRKAFDTVEDFKTWLSQNPLTVQYQLAQESVKTVDLSTSGNWEKIVFNGSENWTYESPYLRFYTPVPNMVKTNNYLGKLFCDNPNFTLTTNYSGMKDLGEMVLTGYNDANNSYPNENWIYITVKSATDVDKLKQWLSQNPITVWYQTTTTLDSTQVKQPIFFKNGHIQLSSGADNSLIPTLDYQAKTSNSYVMDLMKTNTKYTMKAKSASGTFTIDGTSYGAGTNGTFTTPSSMTNKFLVMSNNENEEVMIIEGDVTDKTIPYFKGIKSAFEDESEIEVLSTGKNLFDKHTVLFSHSTDANGTVISSPQYVVSELISVKPNTVYTVKHFVVVVMYDKDKKYISQLNADYEQRTFTTPATCAYVRIRNWGLLDGVELQKQMIEKVVLQEGDTIVSYEPYKSNNTKIPLLSPLRSLPNGVCDELIIDRMKKKATLIQRVGEIYATTSYMSASYFSTSSSNNYRNEKSCAFLYNLKDTVLPFNRGETRGGAIVCEGLPSYNGNTWNTSIYTCAISGVNSSYDFCFRFPNSETLITLNDSVDMVRKQFNRHLDNKNMKLLYELKTPIITEIDLEGFPYVYKDGHLFLNSEISPNTQITYSISQQHQISASTQDLIRHEQELVYLYKLIAQYIQVDYQSTLLSLDLKLK